MNINFSNNNINKFCKGFIKLSIVFININIEYKNNFEVTS